jgi:hypothetical protein
MDDPLIGLIKENKGIISTALGGIATAYWAWRKGKTETKKNEAETEEARMETTFRFEELKDKRLGIMEIKLEKITSDYEQLRIDFTDTVKRHQMELHDLSEKLRLAELLNVELTAELNIYKLSKV